MKRNIMRKNLRQSIRKSIGRYIAIMAIIALGSGMFIGLQVSRTDMVATGQQYTDQQNMFDLRLLNSYGWSAEDVEKVAGMDGVTDAEGSVSLDVFIEQGKGEKDAVYKLISVPQTINKVYLLGGRMPEGPNECLVDGAKADDSVLGTTVTVSDGNDKKILKSLKEHSFTVVGYISTPIYMDTSRGSTTIGDGKIDSYLYVPADAFDVDYFTEINITVPGDWKIYSKDYKDALETMSDSMKAAIAPLADKRFETVKHDAEAEYADGMAEYEKGLAEYEEKKNDALKELEEALRKIEEGQAEIDLNRDKLAEGEKQIPAAEKLMAENKLQLENGRKELEAQKKAAYAKLDAGKVTILENHKKISEDLTNVHKSISLLKDKQGKVNADIAQIDSGLTPIENNITQVNSAIEAAENNVRLAQTAVDTAKRIPGFPKEQMAQLEQKLKEQTDELDALNGQLEQLEKQKAGLEAKKKELVHQRWELAVQQMDLEDREAELNTAMEEINLAYADLEKGRKEADKQFAAAEKKLSDGEKQLSAGMAMLASQKEELEKGYNALVKAQLELDKGRKEYESGKAEANAEFAEAEAAFAEAKADLADAREMLDGMTEPDCYALTRDTNMGYTALDTNSDILAGIARVLPAFFMLVAALVCITTMTRMVEEERTQIGTLKAMGYGNGKIMWKYLFYSGSATILGCVLGGLIGSVAFPWILWDTYSVLFNITPRVVLKFNVPLCAAVVFGYTAVSLLVTWYSCRKTLKEVPAELIRPKAPAAGKKILLEKLPFWNKFSFLNKVMLRNIFRYRQRMLMMLVGIGGCTALLLTGFGIRDSIGHIVDYQFDQISLYDMEVYFSGDLDQQAQEQFRQVIEKDTDKIGFFYQNQMELTRGDKTWSVDLTALDDQTKEFLDFHSGKKSLEMPGIGEALITVGIAEAMDISVGDEVTVYDTAMKSLTVTVSGIYDNHVGNSLIVIPDTIARQWGGTPGCQMAYIAVREGVDTGELSTAISEFEGVVNVSISTEVADMVNSMMDALDMVVVTIVFCAGLLAAIVLYNLTNINITERIREIATIKVLGFNSKETSAYVFKENILLSVMGAALGLLGGKFLLDFVISQVKIDLVWFLPRLLWPSFVYAIVLTLVSAAIVDFIFYFRLEKINMAEALKSVE